MKDFFEQDTDTTRTLIPLHDTHPAPDDSAGAALLRYWEGLCRGGLLPYRAEVDPRAIGGLLPHTFLLERIAPGLARFRVAGTHLAEVMGMDVRGMPASCLIAPGARERLADALTALFDRPARLDLDLHSAGGLARPELAGQMTLLPLRGPQGAVDRALGCLVTSGHAGRAPRRFTVADSRICPIPLHAGAEPTPAPSSRPDARPHLRLVKSD